MDIVFLLVGVVCIEVAVMSLGLFWYLPRAIERAFIDAEEMIERQRDETFKAAAEFIKALACKENIEKIAAVAAPVLGDHIKRAAGGFISGQVRKRGGDLIGSVIEGAIGRFMGGGAPAGEELMGGVPPPR